MNITLKQMREAFTEWDRRYRDDSSKFVNGAEHLLPSTPPYGEACAPYFMQILKEIKAKHKKAKHEN